MKLLALHTTNFTGLFLWKISLEKFSGPDGGVQVEKKQGGGWKEGKKEERLQSMSVQRQSVYVIRVQTESGCQKWSRAHRLTAPPRPVRPSAAGAATTGTVTIGAATLAVTVSAAAATAARLL